MKLLHTNTQLKKLKTQQRRACVIIRRVVPSIHESINKGACCIVMKSLGRSLSPKYHQLFLNKCSWISGETRFIISNNF